MVELYFKDKKLGTLNYDGNIYTYDSNIENENYAKNNYFLNLTDYNLYGSNLKKSQNLFNFFKKIVIQVKKRKDLLQMLKISNNESDYQILLKLGNAKQNQEKFYLKVV